MKIETECRLLFLLRSSLKTFVRVLNTSLEVVRNSLVFRKILCSFYMIDHCGKLVFQRVISYSTLVLENHWYLWNTAETDMKGKNQGTTYPMTRTCWMGTMHDTKLLWLMNNAWFLAYLFPMHPLCFPWKHQRTERFSDVFRGR